MSRLNAKQAQKIAERNGTPFKNTSTDDNRPEIKFSRAYTDFWVNPTAKTFIKLIETARTYKKHKLKN